MGLRWGLERTVSMYSPLATLGGIVGLIKGLRVKLKLSGSDMIGVSSENG